MLRLPHFLGTRLTDGGETCQPYALAALYEEREMACMGGTGGRSTGLPMENERAMNESDV
jgi:hypothetical protein